MEVIGLLYHIEIQEWIGCFGSLVKFSVVFDGVPSPGSGWRKSVNGFVKICYQAFTRLKIHGKSEYCSSI